MTKDAPKVDPDFGALAPEIEQFANHTLRLVRVSKQHRETLTKASVWTEGAAPMAVAPKSVAAAMRAIDKFARIHRVDRPRLFGAYFAHHHLRMQAELSSMLIDEGLAAAPETRGAACRRTYAQALTDRKEWVAALLECCITAAAPELSRRDYAIFNVGALNDHEDVDLAIVVSSIEARDQFARSYRVVSKTFARFASKIQLFLTDQLANPRAGGLIEEYEEIVSNPTGSVVVPMQLLGAEFLCGSRLLARTFVDRVTARFFSESGEPLAHEGFLRSLVAELRHYRSLRPQGELLAPKREIYIPAKLTTVGMRVIHGVRASHPLPALIALTVIDPERSDTYARLGDAFVQNEVLRALMFLYVCKTEVIDLADDDMRDASERVAVLLGLGSSARRSSEQRLLSYYVELRARAMGTVLELSSEVDAHLRRVSSFRRFLEQARGVLGRDLNLAERLLSALSHYQGAVFWDEVVELLETHEDLVVRFLADLTALSDTDRRDAARKLVRMMCVDASAIVELLVYLANHERVDSDLPRRKDAGRNATLFFESLIDVLSSDGRLLELFIRRLDDETESEALFRLATSYPPSRLAVLADMIESHDTSTRGERVVRALRSVIILVHHHSNRTRRISSRVHGRIPEFVPRLGDAERLRALARDLMREAAHERNPELQVELLGDAFDVEAMSDSLLAVLEGSPGARDESYVGAFDRYVRELFKACFREVQSGSPMFEQFRPGTNIAVYATGGFGRGQAFGADWDYLAVVGREERGVKKFFGKVIQRLVAAITRRGLIPHNRLAPEFNSYVVSIDELAEYFSHRRPETFIDEAEVLEARFVLGDAEVRAAFDDRIRSMIVGQNRTAFLTSVLGELSDRRESPPQGLNIKHGPGGLREIHLIWLAVAVFAGFPRGLKASQFERASEVLPDHRADLRLLLVTNAELRRIRDLYRLVVADQESPFDAESLVRIAKDLPNLRNAGVHGDLARQVQAWMDTSALRIDRIAEFIRTRTGLASVRLPSVQPPPEGGF